MHPIICCLNGLILEAFHKPTTKYPCHLSEGFTIRCSCRGCLPNTSPTSLKPCSICHSMFIHFSYKKSPIEPYSITPLGVSNQYCSPVVEIQFHSHPVLLATRSRHVPCIHQLGNSTVQLFVLNQWWTPSLDLCAPRWADSPLHKTALPAENNSLV